MDNRDRRPPIALAADAPVAQAVLRLPLAPALGLGLCNDGGFGLIDAHSVHPVGIHNLPRTGKGDIAVKIAVDQIAVRHHAPHRQIIFTGKIQVALVMRGAAENGTAAIIHQHKVRDIDRQMPAWVKRMFDRQIGIETHLLGSFNFRRSGPALFAIGDKILQTRCVFGQALRQRVVRCNRQKACAKQRIGPRSEHINPVMRSGQVECQLQPLGFADPVFLHQPDLLRPMLQPV